MVGAGEGRQVGPERKIDSALIVAGKPYDLSAHAPLDRLSGIPNGALAETRRKSLPAMCFQFRYNNEPLPMR